MSWVVIGQAGGVEQFVREGMCVERLVLGEAGMQTDGDLARWHAVFAAHLQFGA